MQTLFTECELFGLCVCVLVRVHDLQLLQHLSLFAPV